MIKNYNLFLLAKAAHILVIVLWIGGVGFVTTVLIPAIKNSNNQNSKLSLFVELEGKFSLQAKILNVVAALSGLYMLYYLNAWNRFTQANYWWMHLMVFIWFLFFIVLFILEPIFLHKWFERIAQTNNLKALSILHIMHIILLLLSLVTIYISATGSHGLY